MPMPEEASVLDRRTLNRTLLARQLLLERVEMPVADAIEHLVALQAQEPRDPYVARWSRLRDFDPHELGQLMLDRQAVRMTLLRTTLHLVTARDALALRPVVQRMIERRFHNGTPFGRNLSGIDFDALLAAGIELVEAQPLGLSDLSRLLSERFPGYDAGSLGAAIAFLVPLVQVTPRGVWGATQRPMLTTLSSWLGAPVPPCTSPDAAILRYLRAYGPATTADIRTWSGLRGAREVIDRLRPAAPHVQGRGGARVVRRRGRALCASRRGGAPAAPARVRQRHAFPLRPPPHHR